ncbi:MAG: manganese-binding transcriptional regulator MntR [Planctomycetota bacterium]
MPKPDLAAAHLRTRRDHARETAEDYVEAIAEIAARKDGACRIVDLTHRFGVSHVTAIKIIKRLENEGLVTTQPYQPVQLTPAGKRLARACRKRHQLVYDFLLKLGVDPTTAATDAEGIEHHLSPKTLARLRAFLAD